MFEDSWDWMGKIKSSNCLDFYRIMNFSKNLVFDLIYATFYQLNQNFVRKLIEI